MDTEYEFLPELFLRTPYYSFARYDMDRLPEIINDQVFRNAVWLASPGFYGQLARKNFDFMGLLEKEKHTLHKYYNRMCFRPTPFGSFASFTNLTWGSGARVYLENDERTLLHLLPDQGLISRLNAGVSEDADDTLLTKNPTLYLFGGEFRFIKSNPDPKGKYHFTVDAFNAEPFYRKIIKLFKDGYCSIGRLREWIMNFLECTLLEADEYVTFLIVEQILFKPSVGKIIDQRNGSTAGFNIPGLAELWAKARSNSAQGIGLLSAVSNAIKETLPVGIASSDQLFYAALERPHHSGGPGLEDQQDLKLAIKALHLLSIPVKSGALQEFTNQFAAKFDLEKVPLLIALDPDAGINYSNLMAGIEKNDVLKDLRFLVSEDKQPTLEWTAIHRWLFKIWRNADRDYYAPLMLREGDLTGLDTTGQKLTPTTIAVMYRKTENGLMIEHAGGIPAPSLVGRFSVFSEQAHELAQQIANAEQLSNEGVVFADISQLTDLHVDNINRRKVIYDYEIPLNVYSSLEYKVQIRPEDLYLSVHDGELILESKRLNKRIIPRLATAYNFHHTALGIFRLLCDLQYQGLNDSLSLDLELFFPDLDFYPAVMLGQVMLCQAKWIFTAGQLSGLYDTNESDNFKRVREFRARYQLPQRISIGQGDQQLVFDLGNRDETGFFLKCINGLKKVMIHEYWLPDRSIKTGTRPMAGQYVAFMGHDQRTYAIPPKSSFSNPRNTPRAYPLGSDWLYLKIYCTPESADLILLYTLRPFLIKNKRHIKNWFFIRYDENGYHLRLRINTQTDDIGYLLAALKRQLAFKGHQRLIKELRGDTYRRELERYGADIIHLVEQYFKASSDFILKILYTRSKGQIFLNDFDTGFLISFYLISCFLEEPALVEIFTGNMSSSFLSEFKEGRELRMDMDTKYRAIKTDLSGLLENPLKNILTRALDTEFKRLIDHTKTIAAATISKTAEQRSKLIADLVHMHLNRTFKSNHRRQELFVYYCLNKYISSNNARRKELSYSG